MTEKKEFRKALTPEFRVSFPAVFQPRAFEGGAAKYSLVMLFDEKTDISALRELARQAVRDTWGDDVPKNLKSPFRDGSETDYEGYEGKVFIRATSKRKPGLVDGDVQEIIDESEFYPGCYARATVNAYTYDTAGNKGVAFGLLNIQKTRDGEPLGNVTRSAADDFEPIGSTGSAGASVSDKSLGDEDIPF